MSANKKFLMFSITILLTVILLLLGVACSQRSDGVQKQDTLDNLLVDAYSVKINLLGGGENYVTSVPSGSTLYNSLKAPEREGYDFLGWYKDKSFSATWDFINDRVEEDTEIYARWEHQTTYATDGLSWFSLPRNVTTDNEYDVSLYLKNTSTQSVSDILVYFDDGRTKDQFFWPSLASNEIAPFEFSITPAFVSDDFSYISEYFSHSLILNNPNQSSSLQLLYAAKKTADSLDTESKYFPLDFSFSDHSNSGVSLKYSLSDDGESYSVFGASGSGDLVIPDTFNNKPVTQIAPYSTLSEVLVAGALPTMASWSEYYNTSITSITIGANIRSISNYAFFGCLNVTTISFRATNCDDLERNNFAFYRVGSEGSGISVQFYADTLANLQIPAYLFASYINNDDFTNPSPANPPSSGVNNIYTPKITSIYIPSATITRLGAYAFAGCDDFTTIINLNFSETSSYVGEGVFMNCTSLVTARFTYPSLSFSTSETVGVIDSYQNGTSSRSVTMTKILPAKFFQNCINLVTFNAIQYIDKAGAYSFYSCQSLSTPSSFALREIGDFAFYNSGLTNFSNGTVNLHKIGKYAFSNSINLQSIGSSNAVNVRYLNDIGDYAFAYCPSITSIRFLDYSDSSLGRKYYKLGYRVFFNNLANIYFEIPSALTVWLTGWNDTLGRIYFGVTNESLISQGGFDFIIQDGYAIIIKYTGSAVNPTIPTTVSSYTVQRIAPYAFSGSQATTLTFASTNIDTIENSAFYGATNLRTVNLTGGNVANIGEGAFSGCVSLQTVTFPANIAYYNATTNTNTANTLGPRMFENCSSLTTISLPTNLVNLESRAFANCVGLTTIVAPDSLTVAPLDIAMNTPWYDYIGAQGYRIIYLARIAFAFVGIMPRNASIEIAEGTWYINPSILSSQFNMRSLTIPSTIKTLGNNAFYDCKGLRTINYNAINAQNLASSSNVFYNAGKNYLSVIVNIGNLVESIPEYLFYSTSTSPIPDITAINIPSSSNLTRIGSYAFYYCDNLKEIVIPENVSYIGTYSFYNSVLVETVRYNSKSTSTSIGGVTSNNLFAGYIGTNTLGTTIYIGADVTVIPNYLFATSGPSYNKIANVIFLGNKVTTIGNYAFYSARFTDITLPSSLVSIGSSTFAGTELLATNITIPNSVTSIGTNSFMNSGITGVTIGSGLTLIPANAFYNSKLSSVVIPSTITVINLSAFSNLSNIRSITIYGDATRIDQYAFRYAYALTEFNLGISGNFTLYDNTGLWLGEAARDSGGFTLNILSPVTTIPEYAFYSTSSKILKINFTTGGALETISQYAFFKLHSSVNSNVVIIPNGVTTIGNNAFIESNITAVSIPQSVTSIGTTAFAYIYNLETFAYGGSIPIGAYSEIPWILNNSGRDVTSETSMSGDPGLVIQIRTNVTCIPDYMFFETIYASFVLGGGPNLQDIGRYAFFSNINLIEANPFPSLVSIGEQAFRNCLKLTSFVLPETLTTIGGGVFDNVPSLASFYIKSVNLVNTTANLFFNVGIDVQGGATLRIGPDVEVFPNISMDRPGVNNFTSVIFDPSTKNLSISALAFNWWTKIKTIILPARTTFIDGYAFNRCDDLVIYAPFPSKPASWATDWNPSNCPVYWGFDDANIFTVGNFKYFINSGNAHAYAYIGSATSVTMPQTVTISSTTYPVTSVMTRTFSGTVAKILNISDNVTSLDKGAFSNSNLETINIPKSTTTIDRDAFVHASSLEAINVDSQNTTFSSLDGTLLNKAQTEFLSYPEYKSASFTIPNTVTTIKEYAFQNASRLIALTIPSGVNSIGLAAFSNTYLLSTVNYNCIDANIFDTYFPQFSNAGRDSSSGLTVNIGASVTKIPNYFMHAQTYFKTLNFATNSSLITIGNNAFSNTSIENLSVPATYLTRIGDHAFQECYQLKTFSYTSDSVAPYANLVIGTLAFAYSGLTSLTLQSNVVGLEDLSFAWTQIASLDLTNATSLTTIPRAFYNCALLKSVSFHPDITSIGDEAFAHSYNISSIVIPKNTTDIGPYAFYSLSYLQSLTISENVVSFGDTSFSQANSLVEIKYNATAANNLFSASQVFAYLASSSPDGCRVTIGENVTSIPSYLFYTSTAGRVNVSSVILPAVNNLTINQYAFSNLTSLKSIGISNNVTTISNYAFYQDSALTIYTSYSSQPSGWASNWNYNSIPVLWSRSKSIYSFNSSGGTAVSPIQDFALSIGPVSWHSQYTTVRWAQGSASSLSFVTYPFSSSTNTTLTAVWGGDGRSFEQAFPCLAGFNTGIPRTQDTTYYYYKFVPTVSKSYVFLSSKPNGDPYGYLYNASGTLLVQDDDSGGNNNFKFTYTLVASTVYYIGVRYLSGSFGPISFSIT
ncbi:MAG: leucine-rich repeat protein [Christensenellaceae bacterium]|jgi:uncharacterized repeat protein (TIGR02543 family)|nr:leucine-rich repeat protein [Christensenellaceae bacterium]